MNETDVVYITTQLMNYIDAEHKGADVSYTITTPCEYVISRGDLASEEQDAGRLIFTDDMVMLMKDPTVPVLRFYNDNNCFLKPSVNSKYT